MGIDQRTVAGAWEVENSYGYSWWDSLIVAAALQSGSRYLLSEDLQTGQVIDTITIISPFAEEPEKDSYRSLRLGTELTAAGTPPPRR